MIPPGTAMLDIEGGPPSADELDQLRQRAVQALRSLAEPGTELTRPVFIEFAGTPKSGKSTCISTLHHFFRRCGFDDRRWRVVTPPEGVSLSTPQALKDDLFAYNAWAACYAIQNQLLERFTPPESQADLFLADRGVFDARVWMAFLREHQGRLSDQAHAAIDAALAIPDWGGRALCTLVFTADEKTAMNRENDGKLIHAAGSAMNDEFIAALRKTYQRCATEFATQHRGLTIVDTSISKDGPNFQRIAFAVADHILQAIELQMNEQLLVTNPVEFHGFNADEQVVGDIVARIIKEPRYRPRHEAEQTTEVQQIVPYALLKSNDRWFCTRRIARGHQELRGRFSLLVGGHAEYKDAEAARHHAAGLDMLEACLRREIEEELVSVNIRSIQRIGLIHDKETLIGQKHLAVIHVVEVGGLVRIRQASNDNEFGSHKVEWLSEDEIRARASDLDPWSSFVAQKLFGAASARSQPSLFAESVDP